MSIKTLYKTILISAILFCFTTWSNPLAFNKKSSPWIPLLLLTSEEPLQYIAYHRYVNSYRDLYIVREDGTGAKALATSQTEDEIYADNLYNGQRIVYMQGVSWLDKMGIYAVNTDGTDLKTIIDSNAYEGYWSAASGGRLIIFRWDGNAGACADYDLYSIKSDGTGLATLFNSPENDHYIAATSNDRIIFGTRLPGCGNVNLYSIKADGTGLAVIGASADGYYFKALTTDNRVIYERLVNGSNYDLYSIKADGTGLATIASSTDNEHFRAMTPDNRVLYSVHNRTYNVSYLFIADVDGRNPKQLIPYGLEGSITAVNTVTPTGDIVFTAYKPSTEEDLYVVNQDGSGFDRFYGSGGRDLYCGITKDNIVIFEVYCDWANPPLHDIRSTPLTGLGTKDIADSPDSEVCQTVTPDGRVIYSRYAGGSNFDLFSVRSDGTGLAAIADSSDDEYFMGLTDGNRVIFSRRGNMWGKPNFEGENVDLYSIKSDGTSKVKIAGSSDSESFASIF